jgi:hypothetical protein
MAEEKIPASGSQWIPIVGDWNGSGADDIGIYFAPDSTGKGSRWHLDRNGNEKWNGCENDQCSRSFGGRPPRCRRLEWNGQKQDRCVPTGYRRVVSRSRWLENSMVAVSTVVSLPLVRTAIYLWPVIGTRAESARSAYSDPAQASGFSISTAMAFGMAAKRRSMHHGLRPAR